MSPQQPVFRAMESEIIKVALVVADAVKTAKHYSQLFDLGPWSFYDLEPALTILEGREVADAQFGVRMATNRIGQMGIALLQPLHGSSSYRTFLQKKGEGIHHLSFALRHDYAGTIARLAEQGFHVEMQGEVPGSHAFTLIGSWHELGLYFELTGPMADAPKAWAIYEPGEPGWIPMDGKRVGQIGIITDDVEAMARRYWELLGIGPWHLFDCRPPVGEARIVHGVPVQRGTDHFIRVAIADHPSVQLELIEPVSGISIHREHLQRHGVGAHHLSFDIIDDYEGVAATFAARGIEIEMAGLAGPAYYYTYWSTRDELATLWEAIKFFPHEDPMAGLYAVYPPETQVSDDG